MRLLAVAMAFPLAFAGWAQDSKGIKWTTPLDTAKKTAAKNTKLLFHFKLIGRMDDKC